MGEHGLGMGVHVMSVHGYEYSCYASGWLSVYVVMFMGEYDMGGHGYHECSCYECSWL
jgi:hypothetical protein